MDHHNNTIFISYRRKESVLHTLLLHERLQRQFAGQVFMDQQELEPGENFRLRIEQQLQGCRVMLAVIGPQWGSERLRNPRDWVRLEITTALRRGITVIPVLIDGARMPEEALLPEELHPLLDVHALDFDHERFFEQSVALLLKTLKKYVFEVGIDYRDIGVMPAFGRRSLIRNVRIFLASPSADTLEARARVVQVVNEIGADPLYAPHVRLDLRRWDDPARPVVCDRAGNPQQDIVQQVGSPGDCELVIGIFAHTMGGQLPADRFPVPAEREEAWYCSEWEVEQGLNARRAVWVFHDQRPLTASGAKAKRESLAVSEYIERHNPPGAPMRKGFNPFADLDDLASKLRHGLRQWLSSRYIIAG